MVWQCRCDCGRERLLDTRTLQRGTIRDCGCETKVPPGIADLTGKTFGRLIAISPTAQRKGDGVVWRCVCTCDQVVYVSSRQLLAGYTKSCGCLSHPPIKDYVGKRFGMLSVLSYAGKQNGMHQWNCRCDCGQVTTIGQSRLQNGKTKSCGCLQKKAILDNLKLVEGTSVTVLEAVRSHPSRANSSGHTGVYRNKRSGKWVAQITFQRKCYYLGSYDQKEDAIAARQQGEKMHEDFLAWYYRTYRLKKSSNASAPKSGQASSEPVKT